MGMFRLRRWWAVAFVPLALALAVGLGPLTIAPVSAAPHNSCIGPVPGQHVYDCANLLTPAEIATLEADAAAVDRAGAPTVVYLQVRNATAQQTFQDAGDLLNRWNIESHPGAGDGFVIFFNLQSGNLRHGTFALATGKKHYNGNLPQAELDRIRTDVMTPLLKNGQTAEGIAAGLQQVAHDLRFGPMPPPPPSQAQTVSAFLGRFPINILGLVFAGVVGLLYVRVRRKAPISGTDGAPLDLTATPGDLPPAMAGALLNGRVNDAQMEATILDFAHRGLLVMEPVGKNNVQMRLVGDGKGLTGYEQDVWKGLVAQADEDDHTLSNTDLAEVRKGWSWPKSELKRALEEKGWYDPQAASARRRPLYIAGAIGMAAAAISVIVMIVAQEAWGLIGLVIFLAAGIAAFIWGYLIPNTTVEGELAAAPWRAYRDTVSDRSYEPNVDTDLPYIVSLGLLGKLGPRLKAASERGYSPAWFRVPATSATESHYVTTYGFYPYWIGFHSSMAPVSSGSGGGSYSGGFSGGGAAGGGGGSAGSF